MQKDRLVYAVRGWGVNYESWLVEHGKLWGKTEHDHVWSMLGELLQKGYGGRDIRRMFVDSGFNPNSTRGADNQIYQFCRRHHGRAFPTKGHDSQDRPIKASLIDVTQRGKVIKHGLQLWHLDSYYFKSWLHARIQWPQGESGAFHLPVDATGDYCQQLVAEQRLVKASGRVLWIKTRQDNHYLDAEALNAAAAQQPPRPPEGRSWVGLDRSRNRVTNWRNIR